MKFDQDEKTHAMLGVFVIKYKFLNSMFLNKCQFVVLPSKDKIKH